MTILSSKAQSFAARAHVGQFRKDKQTPYIEHPIAVKNLLKTNPIWNSLSEDEKEMAVCAAVLHDTIEDGGATKKQLESEFGYEIANIVALLSRDEDRESYDFYIQKIISSQNKIALLVKWADSVHNLSSTDSAQVSDEKKIRMKTKFSSTIEKINKLL